MCEQDYENNKIGDYKIFIFFFLQTLNSNFRLSESRALAMSTDNKNLEEFLLINKTNLFKVRPVQIQTSYLISS